MSTYAKFGLLTMLQVDNLDVRKADEFILLESDSVTLKSNDLIISVCP